jgi:hypothetical protein
MMRCGRWSMAELLTARGLRLRSVTRADCMCSGSSRGTVAFDEVKGAAFCHRCGWTASRRALAHELGFAIRHKLRRGIAFVKCGGAVRISADVVEDFIRRNTIPAREERR